jgi:hypothetical protein
MFGAKMGAERENVKAGVLAAGVFDLAEFL